jgi:hypothetical protein
VQLYLACTDQERQYPLGLFKYNVSMKETEPTFIEGLKIEAIGTVGGGQQKVTITGNIRKCRGENLL